MGLDIYAGTLTRYYAHNWKSATQQWAEANGYSFSRIETNGGSSEDKLSIPELQASIEQWRDYILQTLHTDGRPLYKPWEENNEKPYFTQKPDWDAFGALLLYASSIMLNQPLPPVTARNYIEHPLVKQMTAERGRAWSLFSGAECWLPIGSDFYFEAFLPNNAQVVISTTSGLLLDLQKINEQAWQAEEQTILNWFETEGYPVDAELSLEGTLIKRNSEQVSYDIESLAKYAFSVMWQAVHFAIANNVPILMDY